MGTQVVRHKSRIVTEDLQFTANGETSWSFIAEGDGEIYDVLSNNIASYTINGGAISLPFLLTDDNSYTVAIVKTIGSLVADIQFKTRRAVDKTKTVYVPDFSAGDASKLYLVHPDSISILDNSDIINSSVVTVNLPSLPVTPYVNSWRVAGWLTDNRLLVFGCNSTNRELYGCFVNLSDNSVEDFDGVADSYKVISNSAVESNNEYLWFDYDYINGIVYTREVNTMAYAIDLSDNSITQVVNDTFQLQNNSIALPGAQYDPIEDAFVGLVYYNWRTNKSKTLAFFNNATNQCFFDRGRGYKMKKDNNNDGRIYFFDRNGNYVSGDSTNIAVGVMVGWMFAESNKHIVICNLVGTSPTNWLFNFKLYDAADLGAKVIKLYSNIDSGAAIGEHDVFRGYYSGLGTTFYILLRDKSEVNNGKILIVDSSKNQAGDTTPLPAASLYTGTLPINYITANRIL